MQLNQYHSLKTSDSSFLDTSAPYKLFLDIETTGLTSDVSAIFMIGCGYIENEQFHIIQWLADGPELSEEREILSCFSDWVHQHFNEMASLEIITYNGHAFDLPFLKNRYAFCSIKTPEWLGQAKTVDFYRELSTLRHFLPVKNLKLKTISSWLGYRHTEAPSGKQLIKCYQNYIKTKDPALLNLLFLHNVDDLESLFRTSQMQTYMNLFHGDYQILSVYRQSDTCIQLELMPNQTLPAAFEYHALDYRCHFDDKKVRIQANVYPQGLRFYFSDFKNYVYLPDEDYALHKSMAKYMDKSHYIKASADTSYTWFIPDESFFENHQKICDYIQMIFQSLRLF